MQTDGRLLFRSGQFRGGRERDVSAEKFSSDLFEDGFDSISDVKQCADNGPLCYDGRSLIEDYIKQALCVHFHFLTTKRLSSANKTPLGNYCVVLECPPLSDVFSNGSGVDKRRKLEIKRFERATRQVNRAMLVEVGQLRKMPQRATFLLPCRERLERFDKSCSLLSDSLQHREAVRIEFGGTDKNRELPPKIIRGKTFLEKDKQLKYRVVKCTSEIVENFTDFNPPHRRTQLVNDHADCKVSDTSRCPTYSVEMDRRFIRVSVKEESYFTLERVELLAGPLQFKNNS